MKNSPRSVPEQVALVRAWLAAQAEGETQVSFCARQQSPISARALRAYARRHAPSAPPLTVMLAIVDRAVIGLQELRASIAERYAGDEMRRVSDRHADQQSQEQLPSRMVDPPTPSPPATATSVTTSQEPPGPFNFDDDDE